MTMQVVQAGHAPDTVRSFWQLWNPNCQPYSYGPSDPENRRVHNSAPDECPPNANCSLEGPGERLDTRSIAGQQCDVERPEFLCQNAADPKHRNREDNNIWQDLISPQNDVAGN